MGEKVKKFKIEWMDENDIRRSEIVEFEDWTGYATSDGVNVGPKLTITARDWDEDLAYSVADKGWHRVTAL